MKKWVLILTTVVTMLISVFVCLYFEFTHSENLIITLLVGIITNTFVHNVNLINIEESSTDIHKSVKNIESFAQLKNAMENIEHPYFQKWARIKMDLLLSQNREFFAGTNRTYPQADDTWGIEGLKYTKKGGILKAVSVVSDYWEDGFVPEYLKVQEDLIKKKNVTIQRIFVFPKEKKSEYEEQMKFQKKIGIDVRYIFKENK